MGRGIALALLLLTGTAHQAFAQIPVVSTAKPDAATELLYRASLGRGADVKLLIAQGANPNMTNASGVPLLCLASARKDPEAINVVQALIEGGASVNAKDTNGQSALFYAARTGNGEIVNYLMQQKINYYALDNNGDIARTLAFRAGYTHIVEAMDNFVTNQTRQVQDTYQKAQTLDSAQQEKEAQQAAEEARKQQQNAALAQQKYVENMLARKLQYEENIKQLKSKVYDISFHACAFQYWSFCQAEKQTTPLSKDELTESISSHKAIAQDMSHDVMTQFNVGRPYVSQIIGPSQNRIFMQLNLMPSRTYRKELGVCTPDDMQQRCDKIALNWNVLPPKPVIPKPARPKPVPKINNTGKAPQKAIVRQNIKPNNAPLVIQ